MKFEVLADREGQVIRTSKQGTVEVTCNKASAAGSVSQRACTFCGSRVVLYPIADALHLVHGPVGCAAYTWDIRGALSSGPELHRISCSTDLREREIVLGGEKRLEESLRRLIARYSPRAAFVYATCVVGVIGDDVSAVCRRVEAEAGIPVIPVQSEGFRGTKRDGYSAATRALLELIGTGSIDSIGPLSINLMGDFNVAGESWIIKEYFARMGVDVVSVLTGDGRVDEIRRAHGARLNVVQCAGSMTSLAKAMEGKYGIPFIRVSFFGIEDTAHALYEVAGKLGDAAVTQRAQALVREELGKVLPALKEFRKDLQGKRAGLYVGGAFKAFSLVRALRQLGVTVALAGTQTGSREEYEELQAVCDENTIIVDDTNALELANFLVEQDIDVFIGGVKERPIAYKLGLGFCDHNHERKIPLAGFEGAVAFARGDSRHGHKSNLGLDAAQSEQGRRCEIQGGVLVSCAIEHEAASSTSGEATVNPCTLCAPLGAALASAGVRDTVPLLHGAQGCATYIRRYLISHFREPIDVASSSFGESQTVFGGESNLHRALDNVARQYQPRLVTVATTCLAETIGEDVVRLLHGYAETRQVHLPVVSASTPSFKDGHVEGFHTMVRALVEALATAGGPRSRAINILPPIVSPADLRHLREIADAYGLSPTLLPDYSETLDGVILDHYCPLPAGGTRIEEIAAMPPALATLDLTMTGKAPRASTVLAERGVAPRVLGLPIGVCACDALCDALGELSGNAIPTWLEKERGRLLDAYADGHKYVFGKRVAVYGDPELVAGLAGFLAEIGARPVLCATGARNRALRDALRDLPAGVVEEVLEDTDFGAIEAACGRLKPELLIGSSKGYRVARAVGVPLLRAGFPIHDRLGAGRLLHVGYRGTMQLFDSVVNTLLEAKQSSSTVGYSYL